MDDLRKLEEDLEKTVIQALGKLCVNERSILWNNARDLALRIVNLYTQMQENTDLLIGNVAYIEESYMLKK